MKRSLRLVLLMLAIALIAGACGDSGGSSDDVASVADLENSTQQDPVAAGSDLSADDEPATEAEIDQEQALLDFTQCMRDQGIDIDDPTVDADGNLQFGRPRGAGQGDGNFDREAVLAARDICSEVLQA